MSLTVRLLGTSASRPTVERNVSSAVVEREGETLMFDCGEGTQRQMMRYGVSFALGDIFFTHMHTDHVLGVVGLSRTLQLQGRTEPLRLWGPRGSARLLRQWSAFGGERLGFPLEVVEVEPGVPLVRRSYSIVPFAVDHHGSPSLGYALIEDERRGRFNPELARELGVPEGPLWGELHRGRAITLADGRVIDPGVLVGAARPGRRIALTGDTRPCASTVEAARGADLLIHEATFTEDERERAADTGHSTAREAAEVALAAGVKQLLLTHISARYSHDTTELEREARQVFANVRVARDGTQVDVAFPSELAPTEQRPGVEAS